MDVNRCSFCLDVVQTINVIDEEGKKIHQDVFECSKKLLEDDDSGATVFDWMSSKRFLPLFCSNCFKTAQDIFQIHHELQKIQQNLKTLVEKFRCEIKTRASKNSIEVGVVDQIKIENEYHIEEESFTVDDFEDPPVSPTCHSNEFSEACVPDDLDDFSELEEIDFSGNTEIATTHLDDYKKIGNDAYGDSEYVSGNRVMKTERDPWPRVILERMQLDKNGVVLNVVSEQVDEGRNMKKRKSAITAAINLRKRSKVLNSNDLSSEIFHPFPSDSLQSNTGAATQNANLSLYSSTQSLNEDKFCCNICGRSFEVKADLKKHRLSHHGDNEKSTKSLKQKFKRKLKGETCREMAKKLEQCSECGKKIIRINMKRHVDECHSEGNFLCELCGNSFGSKRQKLRHEKNCGKPQVKRVDRSCNICGRPFEVKADLKKHRLSHYGENEKSAKFLKQKFKRKLKAKTCKEMVKNFEQCSECGKTIISINMKRHVDECHSEGNFLCELCGNSFGSKRQQLRHEKNCGKQQVKRVDRTCHICGKHFKHKGNLGKHLMIHSKEKPFICEVCGIGFSQLVILNKHMFIHTGDRPRPFQCPHCDKAFTEKHRLRNHLLVHTGERPHACAFCDKKFADRSTRRKHQLTHKQNTVS